MRRDDHETTVSIRFANGQEVSDWLTGLLIRDPYYRSPNRIELLGRREDEIESGLLAFDSVIEWEIYQSPTYLGGSRRRKESWKGRGYVSSYGSGNSVHHANGIYQKYAEITILDEQKRVEWEDARRKPYVVLSLDRDLRHWSTFKKGRGLSYRPIRLGEWHDLGKTGYRFRFIKQDEFIGDSRVFAGTYIQTVPQIEIQESSEKPITIDLVNLMQRAILPIIIAYFKKTVYVSKSLLFDGKELEEASFPSRFDHTRDAAFGVADQPSFECAAQEMISRGLDQVLAFEEQIPIFHAAAHGYAESFGATVLESALTSAVEAIERLLTIHEARHGLDRFLVNEKKWKEVRRTVKQQINMEEVDADWRPAVRRWLAGPRPALTLNQRVRRMAENLGLFTDGYEHQLKMFEKTVGLRNKIVHGVIPDPTDELHLEVMRSQLIFERLFAGLLGRGDIKSIGHHLLALR